MTATLSEQARAFLSEPRFAVLGTSQPDGSPHLTVMWYELDGDEILMNTAAGRIKDGNLRRDARIAICVEDGYQYVTVSGAARLIEDPEVGLADIIRLARRYHSPEQAEQMGRDQFSKQRRVTIRMSIEHVVEHW